MLLFRMFSVIFCTIFAFYDLNAMEPNSKELAAGCPICCENYNARERMLLITPCKHELCLVCANESIGKGYQFVNAWGFASERTYRCPFCRETISTEQFEAMILAIAKEFIPPASESALEESSSSLEVQIGHITTSIDRLLREGDFELPNPILTELPTIFPPANRGADDRLPSRDSVRLFHLIQRRVAGDPAPYVEFAGIGLMSSPVHAQEVNEYFESGDIIYGDPRFAQQWNLPDLERQPSLDDLESGSSGPASSMANTPISSSIMADELHNAPPQIMGRTVRFHPISRRNRLHTDREYLRPRTLNTDLEQLHKACRDGELVWVRAITEAAENPYEMISAKGPGLNYTALHWAIESRAIVEVLLRIAQQSGRAQEYIAIPDYLGRTALDRAKQWHGNTEAVIELLESYKDMGLPF